MPPLRTLALSAVILATATAAARADGLNPVWDVGPAAQAAASESSEAERNIGATREYRAAKSDVTGSLSRPDLSSGAVDHREWMLQNSAQ